MLTVSSLWWAEHVLLVAHGVDTAEQFKCSSMQIRAERAILKNFILTLFAKQTLHTAGLWEDSRGERQQDFAMCSMLSPNQGGNDHSKYNIVWTSAKSSWPSCLLPAHCAPLWNTLHPLLFRTYLGPGWVGTRPAMYVTSQSSSPCIWQTPAGVEQPVMDHSGATAIVRLRCERHRHRLLLQHFYRVARGSHGLCPAGGNQRHAPAQRTAFRQPARSRQGWGQHCAHVPGQIPAQKQPECPSWAELETTLVYLISQCNVVTPKPVVLMLSEEKHLSWDLYFKLLNILCTSCSIGRSIPPWAEYISISGFCQWREDPSAKP